ncbi:MAG: hypothetical protein ACO3NK_07785, partial [Prochlorotrichaceae cyanobacterium]
VVRIGSDNPRRFSAGLVNGSPRTLPSPKFTAICPTAVWYARCETGSSSEKRDSACVADNATHFLGHLNRS